MWLPETAVDRETLEVLAEEGVRFTLLAPCQAAGVREPGGDWRPGGPGWTRAGRTGGRGAGAATLALFFYDGPISHAVAFDGLLRSGDALATRLLAGFDETAAHPQLVQIATDGETYGHHHRFGEMALAAACARIEASGAATLTNHAAFLAAHPPACWRRGSSTGSSWSCAHGVERWRADCGCRAGRHHGWDQRWRGPCARRSTGCATPWTRSTRPGRPRCSRIPGPPATPTWRSSSIGGPRPSTAFLDRHALRPLDADGRVQALRLPRASAPPPVDVHDRAAGSSTRSPGSRPSRCSGTPARAVQLARALGADAGLEEELLRRLGAAPSNLPELRDGAGVWRRHVAPCATDLARVAAHYAMAGPTEGYGDPAEIHAFRVERRQWARVAVDDASLSIGRVRVTARVTEESEEADVAVLDDGDGQIHARVRTGFEADALAAAQEALLGIVPLRGPVEWTRELEQHFGGRAYTTADVFLDERRRLVAGLAERVVDGSAGAPVERVSRQLLGELRRVEGPIPPGLADVARRLLARAARDELAKLAEGGPVAESTQRLREVLAEARSLAISLGLRTEEVTRAMGSALGCVLETLRADVTSAATADALTLLAIGHALDAQVDLWDGPERRGRPVAQGSRGDRQTLAPLMSALGFAPGALAGPRQR